MSNLFAEYQRAKEFLHFGIHGDLYHGKIGGGGILFLMAAGDGYCEIQTIEEKMLNALEGLA